MCRRYYSLCSDWLRIFLLKTQSRSCDEFYKMVEKPSFMPENDPKRIGFVRQSETRRQNNHFWLDTDCWTGNPTSKNSEFSRKSVQNSRNSPSFRNLENDDKFSEAATIGDIDDLGSIASLSSINERIQEVRFFLFFIILGCVPAMFFLRNSPDGPGE